MAFGDILHFEEVVGGDAHTLGTTVAVGNTIFAFTVSTSASNAVSDNLNGAYTQAVENIGGPGANIFYVISTDAGSAPTFSIVDDGFRGAFMVMEGSVSDAGASGTLGGTLASTDAWTTTSAVLPANSISVGYYGANFGGSGCAVDSPWVKQGGTANFNVTSTRTNTTEETDSYSGVALGLASDKRYSASFATFTELSTVQTTRKSSTFDVETTLGTITTATLNGVNVFDHVTGQVGTTVSFAGAATDEITTSGEYSLVLGDGATTETITVQVNVVGVAPSNNPVQKDGAALASLTGVQVRVTSGANINGTELFYSGTATTDASGNLGNIDLSSTAAADTDPVLLHMRTAAGDSIIASETVGLI